MRRILTILTTALALSLMLIAPAGADANGTDRTDVMVEIGDGLGDTIGWSSLIRRDSGLKSTVQVNGLIPGGVYTFWWIAIQEGGFPVDTFVANGGGAVVGSNGKATVRMRADLGDPSITGFKPNGVNELPFAPLHDPTGARVRVEIAYHGQAEDAGNDLALWLSDFWTGTACPTPGGMNAGGQPHCPVYIAAEHGTP